MTEIGIVLALKQLFHFWGPKKIGVEILLGQTKLGQKIFSWNQILVGNVFGSKKIGLKKYLGWKILVGDFFGSKKIWVRNFFGSKKIRLKKILSTKFRSEIFLGQINVDQKKIGSKFFLHESSSWVKIGLHAENQLPGWSGSCLKVCGGWWVGSNP